MLTKRDQQLILQAHDRHGRRKLGIFLAEGLRGCREGVTRLPDRLLLLVHSVTFRTSVEFPALAALLPPDAHIEEVADAEFAKLAVTETPQGVLCLFRALDEPPPARELPKPYLLVLDRVQDPGNLGTILRTAWAAGLREAWCTEGCAEPCGPKAVRAGMGAQFALTLRFFPDLAAVRAEFARLGGTQLWAAVPMGGISCFAPEFAVAGQCLIIGNEANGITDLAGLDRVTIPMPGDAESLNAAQAATVLLVEGVRRGL